MAEREPRDDERAGGPRDDRRSGGSRAPRSGAPARGGAGKKPYPKRDGDSKPYAKRDAHSTPYGKRDGDSKPYRKREGDSRPYAKRDGDAKPYARRDGAAKPYQKRDGDSKPYQRRDGDSKPYQRRDGDAKPYQRRDGDAKPYQRRDGDSKPYQRRDGDAKPYQRRDGDSKPYAKPYGKRDGDSRPYPKRDGDAPRGERRPYRDDARSGSGGPSRARPTRGGADRPDRAPRAGEDRPLRERHDDPVIPEEVTARDLNASARNELKTLSKENADQVARHLAMASQLIDEDPELAHRHALAASRRAGRIAVVRETLAITAYATGDYALALRELRTYRRISGREDQIALMVDSERGVGRPDRALEVGRAVDRGILSVPVRVELAIAMSGARLDLGDPERALLELEIPEFDPDRAFEWSPALFAARATVLEELGRDDEAREWFRRADVAAEALDEASGAGDLEVIIVEEVAEEASDHDDEVVEVGEVTAIDDDATPEDDPSVEDEVRELLTDAGVDDAQEND